jgi:hypothetical protein
MIRSFRARFALISTVSLLVLVGAAIATVPAAPASVAHSAKKSKKHKKSKKKSAKKVTSVKVTAGTETLTFNAQAFAALEKAKVSVTAVSPATGTVATGFVFPLTGGTLNPSSGAGSVTATGGITFASSFSVPGLFSSESNSTISEPGLVLASASTLSFTSQQASPPTFPFGTTSLKGIHPGSYAGAISLTNLPVSLGPVGVQFLNQFASGAFTAGQAFGTVTVRVSASS